MRTIYLGDTFRPNIGQNKTSRLHHMTCLMEVEPEGDDIPVFDRRESGHRAEYDRPMREEDRVSMRRLPRR